MPFADFIKYRPLITKLPYFNKKDELLDFWQLFTIVSRGKIYQSPKFANIT
jgi:hypothetical protein